MNAEDRAEHARLLAAETVLRGVVKRKRRDAPVKTCYACYQINYQAARICCGCFREFYPSKAKKNART